MWQYYFWFSVAFTCLFQRKGNKDLHADTFTLSEAEKSHFLEESTLPLDEWMLPIAVHSQGVNRDLCTEMLVRTAGK